MQGSGQTPRCVRWTIEMAAAYLRAGVEMSKPHIVTCYRAGQAKFIGEASQTKVELWKPYGSLVVTITEEGRFVLDVRDGAGTKLVTRRVDPDKLVAVAATRKKKE